MWLILKIVSTKKRKHPARTIICKDRVITPSIVGRIMSLTEYELNILLV